MKKGIKEFVRKEAGFDSLFNKLEQNRRTSEEILWAQIFNNTILDSSWLKIKSFSPGRWALGYPGLYIAYRILNDIRPKSILEFGLGESSKLMCQYINTYSNNSLTIIEQDHNWLDFFSNEKFDVRPYTKLLPIVKDRYLEKEIFVYEDLIPSIDDKKYDFIIIDGPWGSEEYSRHQIVDIVKADLLSENFIVLMDDHNRLGEKQTMQEVCFILDKKNIEYKTGVYSGAKDTFILCSTNYQFLVTL